MVVFYFKLKWGKQLISVQIPKTQVVEILYIWTNGLFNLVHSSLVQVRFQTQN